MAGFKESFRKGITTINVKTSNFMEETKQKTLITTQEQEIEKLKMKLGMELYQNWRKEGFELSSLQPIIDDIDSRYNTIENVKKQIEELAEKEREILGATSQQVDTSNIDITYCPACGAQNRLGNKFCEKCGNKLN